MLDSQRALSQDRLLRALTGLNRQAFDALLATFTLLYEQSRQTQPRQRAVGGGRKARLLTGQAKLSRSQNAKERGSVRANTLKNTLKSSHDELPILII
jgi:hypothetical protein